jgi:hypothetical protein
MSKELFEMLLVIKDEFGNDGLMQFFAWELIGVTLYYHRCHIGEVL